MNDRFDFSKLAGRVDAAINRSAIGFDKLVEMLSDIDISSVGTTYPPHNLFRSGNELILQFALAGFKKNELDVSIVNDTLVVKAAVIGKRLTDLENVQTLHRGIGLRHVEKKFQLAANLQVKSTTFIDGLLEIVMTRVDPDQKTVKIDIQ